jgi:3-oxoacyl-[acyl-carrier protein] reductase
MKLDLTGETALVTGASRGIGQAIALALAEAGARVYGTATSEIGATNITAYLNQHNLTGAGLVLDISSPESIEKLITDLDGNMPSILINNAAITRDNLMLRMKDEEWLAVIDANLNGTYRMIKACLRTMLKAKRGKIITITSVVGITGNAGQTNYAAAKAGVIALTKSLAQEVGNRGIQVNAIAPGFIDTDMTQKLPAEYRENLLTKIPLNRAGTAQDIAAATVFLASTAADYITGTTLHVNGGMYMA